MPLDPAGDDRTALIELLRAVTAECNRFPVSPRIRKFRAILAKLDPGPPQRFARAIAGAEADLRAKVRSGEAQGPPSPTTCRELRARLDRIGHGRRRSS
jgi:hypothetical protein